MNWLAKFRFLPLTIFFAALMLTVKISNIWNSADGLISPVIDVSEARAQEREKKPTATKTSETQDTSEAQAQKIDKKPNHIIINNTKKNIVLNCGSGTKYSVLKIIREFEKEIQRKFKLSFKIKNLNETETICSDMSRLKTLLKIDIKKKGIYNCIKDYL